MGKKIARIIGRVLLVVLVTIVMLVGTLFIMIKRICSDSAPAARNLFISTVLESGQMKFLASWFCTDAQINEVINDENFKSTNTSFLFNFAAILWANSFSYPVISFFSPPMKHRGSRVAHTPILISSPDCGVVMSTVS